MAISRNLGHKVTTRLISWEQQVRDAEGSRWNLPIGKYFFGDANQYVFVEYPGNEAVTGPPGGVSNGGAPGGGGGGPPPVVETNDLFSVSFVYQGTGSCSSISIISAGGGNALVAFSSANNYTDYAAFPTGGTGNLYASFVANEQFVVGDGGQIYSTQAANYGTPSVLWNAETSNTTSDLHGIGYFGGGIGIAAFGSNGAFVTFSGFYGADWIAQNTGTSATLRAGTFYNSAYAILVGDGGLMISTPQSGDGSAWTPISSGTTHTLRGICQNNPYGGGSLTIVVGDNGTMLGIAGPNVNYPSAVSSGTTQDLYAVAYNYQQSFWTVVGNNGTILISTDGASWASVNSGTANNLFGVSYDQYGQNGIAVGAGGVLLHTTDGINWSAV